MLSERIYKFRRKSGLSQEQLAEKTNTTQKMKWMVKRMKKLSYLFIAIAILLSDIMCFVIAYNYRDMLCGIEHACYSAPANVAFLSAIPFGIGIIICAVVAYTLHKKVR